MGGGSLDVEPLDDRIRKAREITQRHNDAWSLHVIPLVDRYIDGKVDLVIRRLNADPSENTVVLKTGPLIGSGEFESAGSAIRPKSGECRDDHDIQHPPMLPRLIYLVQGIEKAIPAFPRLEAFNNGLIGSGKPLYPFSSRVPPMEELLGTVTNGKLNLSGTRLAVARGQDVHEDIETAAQAINNRAGFCVDDRGDRLDVAQLNEFQAPFRVQFFEQAVRGIFLPGFNAPLENLELGYGPIDASLSV